MTQPLASKTMRCLADMHCHFRLPPITEIVLPFTAEYADYGVAMPNLKERPILTGVDVLWYSDILLRVVDKIRSSFKPLMTFAIRDNTTPQIAVNAYNFGAIAGKIYPLDVTTNSDEGLRDFFSPGILETFRAMQDIGMPVLCHGEVNRPRTLVTKREEAFLPIFAKLAEMFPKLKLVLEHVSSRAGVNMVKQLGPNVAATITAHHLRLTLNDVIGSGICPHNGCMPTPKDFTDKDALVAAATGGNPKFFFGSDTAPWLRGLKECALGKCGVFSAPVVPGALAETFYDEGKIAYLDEFTSRFGPEFYGLPFSKRHFTVVRNEWTVPDEYNGIVPFLAGKKLSWQIARV